MISFLCRTVQKPTTVRTQSCHHNTHIQAVPDIPGLSFLNGGNDRNVRARVSRAKEFFLDDADI